MRRDVVGSVAAGVLVALVFESRVAEACSFAFTSQQPGLIGENVEPEATAPANVAFVVNEDLARLQQPFVPHITSQDGTLVVPLVPSPTPVLSSSLVVFRPETTPPPGTYSYDLGHATGSMTLSGAVDETRPPTPVIRAARVTQFEDGSGCAQSSCGDHTQLEVDLAEEPTDGPAGQRRLALGIFLGTTREAAANAPRPFEVATMFAPAVVFVDPVVTEQDVWVAVSVFDLAGNESERSAPFQANSAQNGGGCSVRGTVRKRAPTKAVSPWPILAFALPALMAWRLFKRSRFEI
jgi:hypothetical protein